MPGRIGPERIGPERIGPLVLDLPPPPERAPAGRAALHTVQTAGGVPSELAVPALSLLPPHAPVTRS
ncbi:hypothetical protein ACFWWM_05680 [Streptomyces sp. NPDC058682]|uniref:hypothetical protein n=1 Tax=unclassified Streptomyces TaxID=2593676 RepID=UPI00225317FB|nr:hypothetical protein [Streptomyces sp. NBC_01214]MCX4804868.1 hypothetical protein [Streptomyces sp. NBC_01214]